MKRICQKYDVFILSTAPWGNPSAWSDKLKWIQHYFGSDKGLPLYKRLILSHHKYLCKGDVLIDDRIDHNGTKDFEGELLQFGSEAYPDWNAILAKLDC